MKSLIYFSSLVLVFQIWSCGPGAPEQVASAVTISHTEIAGEQAKTVALLSIDGMTCSHGCGGKIQQELQALKGVKSTDLDYSDERPLNVVSVEFDPASLSEEKLIAAVNEIADGDKYHVVAMEVQTVKPLALGSGASSDMEESYQVEFNRFFQILNLFSSLRHLVD